MSPLSDEHAIYRAAQAGQIDAIRAWLETGPDPEALGKALLGAAAAYDASETMLQALVGAGADPNFTCQYYSVTSGPPFFVAAGASRPDTLRHLVSLGANPNFLKDGSNAMTSAAYNTTASALDTIACLDAFGLDPNATSTERPAPVGIASARGRFDMVRMFLRIGADPASLDWTPLMHALALSSASECQELIATTPYLFAHDHCDRTPFLLAAQVGEIRKAAMLLAAGARLNDRGWCGQTALMHAIEMNHVGMVEWLLAQGADVNVADDHGGTALIRAAEVGATDCVRLLLRAGADVLMETRTGSTAIDQATNIETVIMLGDAGGDIDRINGEGKSLLIYACENDRLDFVRQLLAIGADPNRVSACHGPLHMAVNCQGLDIVRALLEGGADPNQPGDDEWTPLFYVRSVEMAELLLGAGADRGCKDFMGNTAADFAKSEALWALLAG